MLMIEFSLSIGTAYFEFLNRPPTLDSPNRRGARADRRPRLYPSGRVIN